MANTGQNQWGNPQPGERDGYREAAHLSTNDRTARRAAARAKRRAMKEGPFKDVAFMGFGGER